MSFGSYAPAPVRRPPADRELSPQVFKGREDSALIEPYGPGGNYWDHEYKHMVLGGVPVTVGRQVMPPSIIIAIMTS